MADDLVLSGNTKGLVTSIENVLKAFAKYSDEGDAVIAKSQKINAQTTRVQETWDLLGESGRLATVTFKRLGEAIQLSSIEVKGEATAIKAINKELDDLKLRLVQDTVAAKDFTQALVTANSIKTPAIKKEATGVIKKADGSAAALVKENEAAATAADKTLNKISASFRKNMRDGLEDAMRNLPVVMNYNLKKAEKQVADSAAKMGLTWQQLKAKMEAISVNKAPLATTGQQGELQAAIVKYQGALDKMAGREEAVRVWRADQERKHIQEGIAAQQAGYLRSENLNREHQVKLIEADAAGRLRALELNRQQQLKEITADAAGKARQLQLERDHARERKEIEQKRDLDIYNLRARAAQQSVAQRRLQADEERKIALENLRTQQQAANFGGIKTGLGVKPIDVPIDPKFETALNTATGNLAAFATKSKVSIDQIIAEIDRLRNNKISNKIVDSKSVEGELQRLAAAFVKTEKDVNKAMDGYKKSLKADEAKKQFTKDQLAIFESLEGSFNSVIPKNISAVTKNRLQQAQAELVKFATSAKFSAAEVQTALERVRSGGTIKIIDPKSDAAQLQNLATKIHAIEQAEVKAQEAAHKFNLSWQSIVRLFAVQSLHQMFYALTNGIRQSVETARDLQIQIGLIQTISESGFDTTQWTKGIIALSNATGLAAKDVASGLYDTLSNQIADGGKALEFMTAAGNFAIATNTSMADSVNAISSALNSYGLDASEATRVSDVFFRMIDLGRVTAKEFSNDIGRILPSADQLGVSLEEVSASLSVLTRSGVTYRQAATSIYNIMSRLLKPAGSLKGFFKDLGVESAQAAIETYGYVGVLGKVAEFAQGRPELVAELFPDIRGLRGILKLAGQGVGEFNSDLDKMYDALGATGEAMENFTNNPGKQFEKQINKLKNYFTETWGTNIVEAVAYLTKNVVEFDTAAGVASNTILTLGSAAAVAGIGKLGASLFTAAKGAEALKIPLLGALGPLGAIAVIAGVVGAAVLTVVEKMTRDMEEAIEAQNKAYDDMVKKIQASTKELLRESTKSFEGEMQNIRTYLAGINAAYSELEEGVTTKGKGIQERLVELNNAFADYIAGLLSETRSQVSALESEIKKLDDIGKGILETIRTTRLGDALEAADNDPLAQVKIYQQEITRLRREATQLTDPAQLATNIAAQNKAFEDLYRLQRATEKSNAESRKNTEKFNEARIKAEAKLRDLARTRALEEAKARERERKATQGDGKTVVRTNGRLDPTDDKQRIAVGTSADKTADLLEKERAVRKELEEIDKQLKEQKVTELGIAGVRQVQERAMREMLKLAEQLARAKAEEKRLLDEEVNKYELLKKTITSQFRDLEKFDFGKQFDAKNQEEYDKLYDKQVKDLEEYKQLVIKNTDGSFKQRVEVLQQLDAYERQLEEARSVFTQKNRAREVGEALKGIEAERDAKQKQLEEELNNQKLFQEQTRRQLQEEADAAAKRIEWAKSDVRDDVQESGYYKRLLADFLAAREALRNDVNASTLKTFKDSFDTLKKLMLDTSDPRSRDRLAVKFNDPTYQNIGGTDERLTAIMSNFLKYDTSVNDLTTEVKSLDDKIKELTSEINETLGIDLKMYKVQVETVGAVKTNSYWLEQVKKGLVDMTNELRSRGITKVEIPNLTPAPPIEKAMGGLIHGSDNIPALLGKGEFVVNAASTRRFYSQLVAMNGARGYNRGGLVTNNVGDINLSMTSSGNVQSDIVAIGKGIKREIRRGRLRF